MAHNPLIAAIQIASETFLLPPGKREISRRVHEIYPTHFATYEPVIRQFIQTCHMLMKKHHKAKDILSDALSRNEKSNTYKYLQISHKEFLADIETTKNALLLDDEITPEDKKYFKRQNSYSKNILKNLGTWSAVPYYDALFQIAEDLDNARLLKKPPEKYLLHSKAPDPLITSIEIGFKSIRKGYKKSDFFDLINRTTPDEDFKIFYTPVIQELSENVTDILISSPKLPAAKLLAQVLEPDSISSTYKKIDKCIHSYVDKNLGASIFELSEHDKIEFHDNLNDISSLLQQKHVLKNKPLYDLIDLASYTDKKRQELSCTNHYQIMAEPKKSQAPLPKS